MGALKDPNDRGSTDCHDPGHATNGWSASIAVPPSEQVSSHFQSIGPYMRCPERRANEYETAPTRGEQPEKCLAAIEEQS
jgi:hypothetical protein